MGVGIVRVAAVLVLLFALVGCQKEPPPYESKYTEPLPPRTVAVIGDSYTGGSDAGGYGPKGWPELVTATLSREGVTITPRVGAEGGSGYAHPGQKGGVFADQIPATVRPDDGLVVLFGSRNDDDIAAADLTNTVRDTLVSVKATAPQAKLLVIGPPWTDANPPRGVLQARDILRDQARAVGATFVDPITDGWFAGRPELIGPDGVHPTDAGHAYMAEKIAPHVSAILTSGKEAPSP